MNRGAILKIGKRVIVRDIEVIIKRGKDSITCMVPHTETILDVLVQNRVSFDPDKLTANGFYLSYAAYSKPISILPLGKSVLIEVC